MLINDKNRKNRYFKIFIFCIFIIIKPTVLYAQNNTIEPPSASFIDGISFFNQEMFSLLNFLNTPNSDNNFFSIQNCLFSHYFSFYMESTSFYDNLQKREYSYTENVYRKFSYINIFNVRIKNVYVSNIAAGAGGGSRFVESTKIYDTEQETFYQGAGFALKNDTLFMGFYGFIQIHGVFSNHRRIRIGNINNIGTQDETISWDELESIDHYFGNSMFNYSIIPIYYPKKITFIKQISALLSLNLFTPNEGYLNFNFAKSKLLDRDLLFNIYYSHEIYDPIADNNKYGVLALLHLLPGKEIMQVSLSTGYQQFVNIKYDFDQFYKNAIYLDLGLKLNFEYCFLRANITLDRSNSPVPRIDISLGLNTNLFHLSGRGTIPTGNEGQEGFGLKLLYGLAHIYDD